MFGIMTHCVRVTRRGSVLTSAGADRRYQQFCTRSPYSRQIAEAAPFCGSVSQFVENNNMDEMCGSSCTE